MEQPDEIGAVNTPAYQLNRFLNQASRSLCLPAQRLSNYAWTFIEIVRTCDRIQVEHSRHTQRSEHRMINLGIYSKSTTHEFEYVRRDDGMLCVARNSTSPASELCNSWFGSSAQWLDPARGLF